VLSVAPKSGPPSFAAPSQGGLPVRRRPREAVLAKLDSGALSELDDDLYTKCVEAGRGLRAERRCFGAARAGALDDGAEGLHV